MLHDSSGKNRPGLWVAVFGPDGAGKSATIHRLSHELSNAARGVEHFHFRPMFTPQWQDSSPVTNPHGRPPRCFLISVLKLVYWVAGYWYGYLLAIRPGLLNATLILFDRYYDDVLVDPRRYRLPVSVLWFAKFLRRLVPSPDLYILLDVPCEALQQRKREVSCEESYRQRMAYLQMFRSRPNAFIVDAAGPLDEVTGQMKSVVLHTLESRLHEQEEVSLIASA